MLQLRICVRGFWVAVGVARKSCLFSNPESILGQWKVWPPDRHTGGLGRIRHGFEPR